MHFRQCYCILITQCSCTHWEAKTFVWSHSISEESLGLCWGNTVDVLSWLPCKWSVVLYGITTVSRGRGDLSTPSESRRTTIVHTLSHGLKHDVVHGHGQICSTEHCKGAAYLTRASETFSTVICHEELLYATTKTEKKMSLGMLMHSFVPFLMDRTEMWTSFPEALFNRVFGFCRPRPFHLVMIGSVSSSVV